MLKLLLSLYETNMNNFFLLKSLADKDISDHP